MPREKLEFFYCRTAVPKISKLFRVIFRVPTDKSTYETWCKIIRRNVINFVPKPGMEVCSIHFHRSSFLPDGDLKSNATPMYFPILHDVRCCVQGCSSRQSTNQVFQKYVESVCFDRIRFEAHFSFLTLLVEQIPKERETVCQMGGSNQKAQWTSDCIERFVRVFVAFCE